MVSGAAARHARGVERIDREEMASFLRNRRARVQPADVGVPAGPRRRVAGLRRQEVAQLAGMSVDYYIRLEQGRGPRPSRQMLSAISRALRLTDGERSYLHHLAGEAAPMPDGPARDVRPGVLRLLDRLADTPALVCDAKYDVLAWNAMATALLGDFAALAPGERNIIRRFFTDQSARARHDPVGGEHFARESVADLRSAAARYPDDPAIRHLIDDLCESSAEFRDHWDKQEVTAKRSRSKRLYNASVGWLDLDCEALHDPDPDHWIILYSAAPGTPAHEALKLLNVIGTQQLSTDSR